MDLVEIKPASHSRNVGTETMEDLRQFCPIKQSKSLFVHNIETF